MELKYILLATLIVGSISCSDETLVSPYDETETGIPVDVKLTFSAPAQNNIITSRVADYAVNNLYIIVCKESGSVVFSHYYTSSELNTGSTGSQPNPSEENNWVTATLPTGRVHIYAFANVEDDVYPGLKNKLQEIAGNSTDGAKELIKELEIDVAKSKTSLGRPGGTWVMSGTCTDNDNTDYYTINSNTTDIKIIKLRRLDSIITFNITSGGKCTTFKARRWYVMNAPASTYVLERDADRNGIYDGWDSSNEETGFYNSFAANEQDLAEISANTFTFYMPENRKVGKKTIGNSGNIGYQYREKQLDAKPEGEFINGVYVKDGKARDRSFDYAPNNGTYVVITGTYEGTANSDIYGKEQTVSANVVYKIHLGYVGNNPDDFFSERNTKYTYNVKVMGVDNIVVEVETDTENNPGATGEVIFTEGDNIYTLDAHYENVLLTFKESELKAQSKDAFRCIVKTPFTSLSSIENCDVEWVQVMRNNKASGVLQEYPGDNNDKLQGIEDMLDDLYYATHPDAFKTDYPNNDYPRNISGLFTNGTVTYTCYVNEFYYDNKPKGVVELPEERSALWKHFVNKPNRLMYIVCNTQPSKDGESSVVSAKYILSQRSIQTIYTTETGNGLTTAYGIETINESGQLPAGNSGTPNDQVYGWKNTWKTANGKSWNIINHTQNGYTSVEKNATGQVDGMASNYKYAYIACMQRNRKSGSGSNDGIEQSELKWYLPAVQQYQAIYVGESGINEEAWLYKYEYTSEYPVLFDNNSTDGNGGYKHYLSSTYKGEDKSPQVVWSEEGTSTSTLADRNSWKGWGSSEKAYMHIRCARNLGTVSGDYQDFKKSAGNVIGVPYFNNNTNSRRGTISGELGEHYNDSHYVETLNNPDNNKLSETGYFEIYTGDAPESNIGNATGGKVDYNTTYTYQYKKHSYSNWKWAYNEPTHPKNKDYYNYKNVTENKSLKFLGCESISVSNGERHWRTPNLREFTLMDNYSKLSANDVCRTKYYYSHRKGWFSTGANITMGNNTYTEGAQIRCIRDCTKPRDWN